MDKAISLDACTGNAPAKIYKSAEVAQRVKPFLGVITKTEGAKAVIEHFAAQGWRLVRMHAFTLTEQGESQPDSFVVMVRAE